MENNISDISLPFLILYTIKNEVRKLTITAEKDIISL